LAEAGLGGGVVAVGAEELGPIGGMGEGKERGEEEGEAEGAHGEEDEIGMLEDGIDLWKTETQRTRHG
jgi:hypothetical protein